MKIYLSKSNKTNIDIVDTIRQLLKNNNVDVMEYVSGAYSNKDLLISDYLIIIPDITTFQQSSYTNIIDEEETYQSFIIGKGISNQIDDFKKKNNIYVMININTMRKYSHYEVYDKLDFIYNSKLYIKNDNYNLKKFLESPK